ncbi:MAG: hypothetical protein IJ598_04890 [Ruminococcus sp.]|nr:hypothetical protein [Ruminococcus sp.]
MSTKEKIYQIIDGLSEEQLNGLLTMLTGYAEIIDEAQDNAFCAKLYEESKDDDDGETVSVEDFAKDLGISIA